MSRESEIAYVLQNVQLEEDEQDSDSAMAYMGYISGGDFQNNEGICVITKYRVIFSSEPNVLSFIGGSQGMFVWALWQQIEKIHATVDRKISCTLLIENKIYTIEISVDQYETNYDNKWLNEFFKVKMANVINYKAIDVWHRIMEHEEKGQYAECFPLIKMVRKKDPNTAWADYLEANYKSLLSDYSGDYLNLLDSAEKKGFNNITGIDYLRGSYFLFTEDFENAEIYFKKVVSYDPDNIEVLQDLLITLVALSKYVEAEGCIKKILKIDPENIFAYVKEFYIAKEEENTTKVDGSFSKINSLVKDKADWEYKEIAAEYYNIKKDYEKALSFCDHIINNDEISNLQHALLVCNILISLNRFEDVVKLTEKKRTIPSEQQFLLDFFSVFSYYELGDFNSINKSIHKIARSEILKSLIRFFKIVVDIEINRNFNNIANIDVCRKELRKEVDSSKLFKESDLRTYYFHFDYYEAVCLIENGNSDKSMELLKNALKMKADGPADTRICENSKILIDRILSEKEGSPKIGNTEKDIKNEEILVFKGTKNSTIKHLKKMKEIFEGSSLFYSFKEAVSGLISEYDRPFLLTVLGEFNAGKSTFINALLGEELLSVGDIPTTATISLLKYGDKKTAKIIWNDETIEEINLDLLKKYTVEKKDNAENEILRKIKYVEISYPLDMLKNIWIVDTPGLNAIIPEHKEVTNEFIKKCDGVAWLFSAQQAGKQNELNALMNANDYSSKTIGIINQIDKIDPDERSELIEYISDKFSGLISTVIPVSAKKALEAKLQGDINKLNASKLDIVERILHEEISAKSVLLKEQSVQQKIKHYSDEGIKKFNEYSVLCETINANLSTELEKIEKIKNCIAEKTYKKTISEGRDLLEETFRSVSENLEKMIKNDQFDNLQISQISLKIKNSLNVMIDNVIARMIDEPSKLIEQIVVAIKKISKLNIDSEIKESITKSTVMFSVKTKEIEFHLNALKEYNRGRLESKDLLDFYFNDLSKAKSTSQRDIRMMLIERFSYNEARIDRIVKEWSTDLTEILTNLITVAEEEIRAKIEHEKIIILKPLKNIISETVSSGSFSQKEIDIVKFEWDRDNSTLELLFKIMGKIANVGGSTDFEENAVKNIISEMKLESDQKNKALASFFSTVSNNKDGVDVISLSETFFEKNKEKPVVIEKVLSLLYKIALADNYLAPEEEALLKQVCSSFQINNTVHSSIKESYMKQA